jgi:CHAD domain-containing protein
LDTIVPLRITVKAKAQRGYELIENHKQIFEKATPLELDPDIPVGEPFRTVARNCLHQILANEPGVRGGDAEALHQMRIGLRRLRTAIVGFAKLFTETEQERIKAELKWATNQLGPARDLDVLAADVLKHLSENDAGEKEFAEVSRDFTARRAEAYARAGGFLRSDRFRKCLLDVTEWIETGPWTNSAAASADTERPVEEHAAAILAKRRKQVRKRGRHLSELSARARHELRISAKKLRYMTEFFAGVFPGQKNAKRREAALTSLKQLQENLGRLNDIALRKKTLASNGDGLGAHAAAMLNAEDANADKLLKHAQAAHADFSTVRDFWKY